MAIPRIEAITPARGHTGGRTLVQIDGHNFRVPRASPPGSAPAAPPPPTVRVLFGGVPATAVKVVSEHLLRCSTPRHSPDRFDAQGQQIAFGTVDVVVENLADDGTVISSETVTLADCYSFVRPELAPFKGAWARVLSAFRLQLQELLLENVALNPSVDYDPNTMEPVGYVQLAEGPGIALTQISFPPSTDEQTRQEDVEEVEVADDYVLLRRAPIVTDITGQLVAVSTNETELVNLCEAVTHVIRDFGVLELAVDPEDASHGVLAYRIELGVAGLQLSQRFGQSDLMTAEGTWRLKSVLSSDLPGAPLEGVPQSPKWYGHAGTVGITRKARSITATTRHKP